jgi:hypothetical protein
LQFHNVRLEFHEAQELIMVPFRFTSVRLFALLAMIFFGASLSIAQTPRAPSDVVREFYKAMREHRFRDAFALTSYKPAVDPLTAEDMADLQPLFEEKAKEIPESVDITGEQVNGNSAMVFVRVPMADGSAQVTSQPLNLAHTGSGWIIMFGSEADAETVRKAGRRYLLDLMLGQHEDDAEDFLKRLMLWEVVYSQQHGGVFGDFAALMQAGSFSPDVIDPKLSGYNFHIVIAKDGKSYIATAEPARHGHTGRLSFWSDQTGAVKSADNGGKPFKP